MDLLTTVLLIFSFFIIVSIIFSCAFIVEQQNAVIIERFGKFLRIANAGLNFKIPFIDRKAGIISLRVQQLDIKAETKTHDNVFVHLTVAVQYYVLPNKIPEAFYKLNNPKMQINSYVYDVVRAKVPKMILDNLFENKDEIALEVKGELAETMIDFGFGIVNALVTDVEPDAKVKEAMNEINAAQRLRVASTEKGEADRILKVKAAQAEAESNALHGKGVADQRKAIIEGLQESVAEFQHAISGTTARDVMNIVMMTQYFDTLKELATSGKTTTLMIPSNPAGVADLTEQMRNAIIAGNNATL
jgi:regulator of protease activity HflC (stomatin/prohibitin superfamily)